MDYRYESSATGGGKIDDQPPGAARRRESGNDPLLREARPSSGAAPYRGRVSVFPREAARRLRFIKRAQELGFSLNEIAELLAFRMKPGAKQTDMRMRAEAKISDIDQKIPTLQAMKKTLHQLTERCEGCGPLAECAILESLDEDVSE